MVPYEPRNVEENAHDLVPWTTRQFQLSKLHGPQNSRQLQSASRNYCAKLLHSSMNHSTLASFSLHGEIIVRNYCTAPWSTIHSPALVYMAKLLYKGSGSNFQVSSPCPRSNLNQKHNILLLSQYFQNRLAINSLQHFHNKSLVISCYWF